MRFLVFFLALLYAPLAGATPQTYCEGKYNDAAGLVDAALVKYGTLYSGGLHWHMLDNVGATLDLYRFWNGAPDIGLRKFTPPHYGEKDLPQFYFYPEAENNLGSKVTDIWRGAKKGLSLKSKSVTREELIWTAWGMDVLTSLGPTPDWWHNFEQVDNLSPSQKWVAEKSKSEPVLDWLQTVLTASNAPWAQHAFLAGTNISYDPGYKRLAQAAYQRYEDGAGIEWLVASAINDPRGPQGAFGAPYHYLKQDVKNCTASPQEYAAVAIIAKTAEKKWLQPNNVLQHLPNSVQKIGVQNYFFRAFLGVYNKQELYAPGSREKIDTIEWTSNFRKFLPNDQGWQEKIDVAQLYLAANIDEVPQSANGYVRRAYNYLSTDDLNALAHKEGWEAARLYGRLNNTHFAKKLPNNLEPSLLTAVFARYISLGEWDNAEVLLPDLKIVMPGQADNINRLWALDEPQPIRLALIALHTPNLTTLISGGSYYNRDVGLARNANYVRGVRNLPRHYAHGQPLQRDFEAWLQFHISDFWGVRGVTIPAMTRASRRGPPLRSAANAYMALQVQPSLHFNKKILSARFESMLAWDEVGRLSSGDERFMHRLAVTLIPWAEQKTNTFEKRMGDNTL